MKQSLFFFGIVPFLLVSCFSGKTPVHPTEKPITCSGSWVVAPGATIVISYTGTLVSNGKVFDATGIGKRGPRPIRLASGQFPAAFDRSIVCMKVGESKTFTLSPDEAYGKKTIESEFVRAAFGTGISSLREGSEYTFPSNMKVKIVAIGDKRVTIEQPNPRPLAGESLRYEVRIEEVK